MEVERMRTLIGDMDGNNPSDALSALSEVQKELGRTEAALVRRARQSGMSWEMIAACLGVSKQAVHKKFGKR
ncbi:MAG: AsnC family protein [Renibacterium sp.]|nr:AsnC family protein [Renibacterium sp.]